MKSEPVTEARQDGGQSDGNSQMTDVVMREMSEAQAEAHMQDTRMSTVLEAREDQEGEGEGESGNQEQQIAEQPAI